MLFVKMMSGEDLPDTHAHKGYSILQVTDLESIRFFREKQSPESGDFNEAHPYTMSIEREDETKQMFALSGNVYILSESGKTIASHGC